MLYRMQRALSFRVPPVRKCHSQLFNSPCQVFCKVFLYVICCVSLKGHWRQIWSRRELFECHSRNITALFFLFPKKTPSLNWKHILVVSMPLELSERPVSIDSPFSLFTGWQSSWLYERREGSKDRLSCHREQIRLSSAVEKPVSYDVIGRDELRELAPLHAASPLTTTFCDDWTFLPSTSSIMLPRDGREVRKQYFILCFNVLWCLFLFLFLCY